MTYIGLDTSQYEHRAAPAASNDPLPVGLYSGVVVRTAMKDCSANAKDPNGKYLEVEFDITTEGFEKRKFWQNFNLKNTNALAVEIGKGQLSDLAKAQGLEGLGEEEELHGNECCMYLGIEPASNGYSAKNKCLKYLPLGSTKDDYHAWASGTNKGGSVTKAATPAKKSWGAAPTEAAEPAAAKPTPSWKK